MSQFRLPLSGSFDLWQDINPFRLIFGPNAHLSLVNSDKQRAAIEDFKALMREIDAAKQRGANATTNRCALLAPPKLRGS